jgi:hypothetical protein
MAVIAAGVAKGASLEQHERKGDEVGNPATPIVEAVKHGDD